MTPEQRQRYNERHNIQQREKRLRAILKISPDERTRYQRRLVAEARAGPHMRWCWWHQMLHHKRCFGYLSRGKDNLNVSCREAQRERVNLQKRKGKYDAI